MSARKVKEPAFDWNGAMKCKTRSLLNFRSGPGLAFDVIRVLSEEERLAIIPEHEENGYVEAYDSKSARGWVDRRYIEVL